jgi:hypothetical protein
MFDDGVVEQFQTHADDWLVVWMSLVRCDGITNYNHIISHIILPSTCRSGGGGAVEVFTARMGGLQLPNQECLLPVHPPNVEGMFSSPNTLMACWMQRKLFFLSGDYLQCDNDIGY